MCAKLSVDRLDKKTQNGKVDQPANQRAPQSLRGHALPARSSREEHADKTQQRA